MVYLQKKIFFSDHKKGGCNPQTPALECQNWEKHRTTQESSTHIVQTIFQQNPTGIKSKKSRRPRKMQLVRTRVCVCLYYRCLVITHRKNKVARLWFHSHTNLLSPLAVRDKGKRSIFQLEQVFKLMTNYMYFNYKQS